MTVADTPAAAVPARRQRTAPELARELNRLDGIADLMDSRFRLPGTKIRFGLDAIVGLLPGIGDGLVTLPAFYILARAHHLGVPKTVMLRMVINVALDFAVGIVPLVGDFIDVGFRANRRNVALLRDYFAKAGAI